MLVISLKSAFGVLRAGLSPYICDACCRVIIFGPGGLGSDISRESHSGIRIIGEYDVKDSLFETGAFGKTPVGGRLPKYFSRITRPPEISRRGNFNV